MKQYGRGREYYSWIGNLRSNIDSEATCKFWLSTGDDHDKRHGEKGSSELECISIDEWIVDMLTKPFS